MDYLKPPKGKKHRKDSAESLDHSSANVSNDNLRMTNDNIVIESSSKDFLFMKNNKSSFSKPTKNK